MKQKTGFKRLVESLKKKGKERGIAVEVKSGCDCKTVNADIEAARNILKQSTEKD